MKVYLLPNDGSKRVKCTVAENGEFATLKGPCPNCKNDECRLQGTGKRYSKDDRAYEAHAIASCCNTHVGTLRAEPNTLFGVREDEAVFRCGIKIY